jgi:hypothetical protein
MGNDFGGKLLRKLLKENRSISVDWDFSDKLSCRSNGRLLSGLVGGKDLPRNVA